MRDALLTKIDTIIRNRGYVSESALQPLFIEQLVFWQQSGEKWVDLFQVGNICLSNV